MNNVDYINILIKEKESLTELCKSHAETIRLMKREIGKLNNTILKKDKKKDREKSKRRLKGWEIALIIVGAPLWVPILVFLISMIFSLYSIFWSVIVSLWSIFGALAGASIGGIICGIIFACTSRALAGLVIVAAGLLCAGLAIFAFFGCLYVTKGGVWLTKKTFMGIINIFREKEGA